VSDDTLSALSATAARVLRATADTLDTAAEWWDEDAVRWRQAGDNAHAITCQSRSRILVIEAGLARAQATAISSAGGWGLSAPAQVNQGLMRSEPLPADEPISPTPARESYPQPTAADGSGPRHQTYTPAAAASI
jgi:hypothetical protein